jgi:EVE domain
VSRYWVGVASSDHVAQAVQGQFAQLGHCKLAPLRRLHAGDLIVYYSPKTALKGGTPLRAFTAIGRVAEGEVYQIRQVPGITSHRRRAVFRKRARAAAIEPLLEKLAFTRNKSQHWGIALRRGLFEISQADFNMIAKAMGVRVRP